MRPLATVCVTTIPARRSLLSRLLFNLTRQPSIELLVYDGLRPMGDKLNEMFAAALGAYVVAVDDDDMLSDAYVAMIASTLKDARFDFVGHDILWLEAGRYSGLISHSLDGDPEWRSLDRGVSPKCPVRTEIARAHEFGNHYTADRDWSQAVHAECETGFYIPAPLYIYDHWDDHMVGTEPGDERASRPQRDVGSWPCDPKAATWLA
jgi:hypothetical protein